MAGSDRNPGKGKSEKDPKPGGDAQRPPSPTARRQQLKREERLQLIQEQIEEGTLTIRKMTPAERKQNPPRPRKGKRKRS